MSFTPLRPPAKTAYGSPMQTLIVSGRNQVQWQETTRPTLRDPRAALVRPFAAATCDFDHLIVAGALRAPLPVAIGHECVAQVLEIGSEVTNVRVGDRVIVPFQISCGACGPCRRGRTSACAAVPWLSCYGLGAMSGDWGSAFSDVLAVPYADAMLVPLPENVSPLDAAALSCNVVDAYRAVAPQLAEFPGAPVLIASGAFRNIALYAVVIARALGAERVDFYDRDPKVVERAARLGAVALDSPSALASMAYPITVEASMDPGLMAATVQATARGGSCTITTMFADPSTRFPLLQAFERCLTLVTGQPHARAMLQPVLSLLQNQPLGLSRVADGVVPWESAPMALLAGKGKVVCTRPELAL